MNMELDQNFRFVGLPARDETPPPPDLGPLKPLCGTWEGTGFNLIWRPFHSVPPNPPGQDHFLELNLTREKLRFGLIDGVIPNRGLLQYDIPLGALYYLQQVSDQNADDMAKRFLRPLRAGIHVETGMWLAVPDTDNPNEPGTVVRMASVPHGATILAQGTARRTIDPPDIPPASIMPYPIGYPQYTIYFEESDLCVDTDFRTPPPLRNGITQCMVTDPNSILRAAIKNQTILETTILQITSQVPPFGGFPGSGTSNIAFLAGTDSGSNAVASEIDATFWIETVKCDDEPGYFLQLQYSQTVLLNFNALSWPHVSVATLRKVFPKKGAERSPSEKAD
jgi:hypothetical protein